MSKFTPAPVLAADLLTKAYSSAGFPPDALLEEDLLAAEVADIVEEPDAAGMCRVIYHRCVLEAVNEALDELSTPLPPSRSMLSASRRPSSSSSSGGLAALLASAREQRTAELPADEWVKKVVALLPAATDVLPTMAVGLGDELLPDDVGAATRKMWKSLAHDWTDYGEDEWAAARAKLPRAQQGSSEEDVRNARAKLAAELFWEGREAMLLTDEELHVKLWDLLRQFVSPPWPDPDALKAERKERRKKEREAAREAAKKKLEEEEGSEEESEESEEGEEDGESEEDKEARRKEKEEAREARKEERRKEREAAEAEAAEVDEDDDSDASSGEALTHDRIHYDDYLQALSHMDARKVAPLKSARAFLTMRVDEHGRVSIRSLYAFACSLTQLLHTRVHLALLEDGRGYLSENALETFVQESIPRLACLKDQVHLQPGHSFLPFYVAHCVRKLYMLLDSKERRGVPVDTLLLSSELASFFALAAEPEVDEDGTVDLSIDEDNWFSLAAAIRIYRQFLELDSDQDGMLTSEELARYGDSLMSLTPAFVDRLFEVINTFDGRLDYKGYLDFVISCEHRSHPQCLAYLFRILDLDSCGSLGVFDVHYFVRDIVQGLLDSGDEPPELHTIVDEIFDLAKMRKPRARSSNGQGSLERARLNAGDLPRITLAEIAGSGAGSIIMQCLIDVQGFWNWDNRESLIEYEDEDRYEKDQKEAAKKVTLLFSAAARQKRGASLLELLGGGEEDDEASASAESRAAEMDKLRSARTVQSLLALMKRAGHAPPSVTASSPSKARKPGNRQAPAPAPDPRPAPELPPAPKPVAEAAPANLPAPARLPPPAPPPVTVPEEAPVPPPEKSPPDRPAPLAATPPPLPTYPRGYFSIPPLPSDVEIVWPEEPAPTPPPKVEKADFSEATKDGPGRTRTRRQPTLPTSEFNKPQGGGEGSDGSMSPSSPGTPIPGMPAKQVQATAALDRPVPAAAASAPMAPAAAPATAAPAAATPAAAVPAAAPAAAAPAAAASAAAAPVERKKLAGPPPLLMGEFSADDVLLWLQTSAFKKRPVAVEPPATGVTPRSAYRARIIDEVRGLQRKLEETAC